LALHVRVFNVSRNYSMKRPQALRAVEQCAATWVEFGVSIRDLSFAESVAARIKQAQEPLGLVYMIEGKAGKMIAKPFFAELPSCVYMPAEQNQAMHRQGYELVRAANQFATLET
jgi:hypothetical protein